MRIVVVGARNRKTTPADIKLINDIIDNCKDKYGYVTFVVASCDKGVGQIVKERNRKHKETTGSFEFNCAMYELYHSLVGDLSQSEFTSHWMSLNNSLVEIGDEFHLLVDEVMKGGTMYDLVEKIKALSRPYATYTPKEAGNGVKSVEITKAP